jgi:hypothetical protein
VRTFDICFLAFLALMMLTGLALIRAAGAADDAWDRIMDEELKKRDALSE